MVKKTFNASCHCKAITYTVAFDPDTQIASRCNCTLCAKRSFTFIHRIPLSDITFLTPKELNGKPPYPESNQPEPLHTYSVSDKKNVHWFCGVCGVSPYSTWGEYVAINLNVVETESEEDKEVLAKMTERGRIKYYGTRDETLRGKSSEVPYEHGIW